MHSLKVGNLVVTDQDYMVEHYKCLFNEVSILQDNGLVKVVIPHIVNAQTNNLLTMLPSEEEIYNVVFNLKRERERLYRPRWFQTTVLPNLL